MEGKLNSLLINFYHISKEMHFNTDKSIPLN